MKKTRLLSLVLVICALLLCALVVASCGGNTNTQTGGTNTNTNTGNTDNPGNTDDGGDEDELYTYTVYFENQNGQPIEGVNAQLCLPGGFCLPPKTSDAEGVCKFQFTELTNLEIQINAVPDGYIMIEGYIPFPEGKTSRVVTIEQNVTYTVTASDLHGQKLENILVEFYKEDGDVLVATQVTGTNGRAEFTASPDKYYAVVKHAYDNGAFNLISDSNVFSFEKSKNMQVQFAILTENIDYVVSLNGENSDGITVNLYNSKYEVIKTGETVDGEVTFKVPNGLYFAEILVPDGKYAKTVIFEKNGKTSANVEIENVKAGSDKQHAIMILGDINLNLEAGEQLWYSVPFAKGKTLKVENASVEILYGGKTNKPNDGVIKLELKEEGEASFRITSKAAEAITVAGEIYKLGSLETPNPIAVDSTYIFTDVSVDANGRVYYSFVAGKDGTVRVETETDYAVITINGNVGKKSVKAGDTVVICFYTYKQVGDTVSAPAAEIDAELSFEKTYADYTVTVKVDNNYAEGMTVELYEYVNGEYVFVATGTTNADGEYTFENLVETADYYVKAIYASEYETVKEYESFADEVEMVVYVTHKRDGSQLYPYLVDSESGTNTTEVVFTEGGDVWYTLFYIQGSTISIDNKDATVTLYRQSGDGAPTLVATIAGESLEHVIEGDYGTTTRLLIKVTLNSAGSVNLTYTPPQVEEE